MMAGRTTIYTVAAALLVALLSGGAGASLTVSNGGFEADDVAANSEDGGVDITDWFESDPTASYYEWIRDDADQGAPNGGPGGAGVAEDNNWASMPGNVAASNDLFLHQAVGTLDGGFPNIEVSGVTSDRGDRGGSERHAAIVEVSLWFDDGSATLADGTALDDTAGLTLIGSQTVGASVGGSFTDADGNAPDVDLTTLDPAGQALSEAWDMDFDIASSNVTAGDTVYLQFRYFDASEDSRSEVYLDNIGVREIPEPASLGLLGLGGLVMMGRRRRG